MDFSVALSVIINFLGEPHIVQTVTLELLHFSFLKKTQGVDPGSAFAEIQGRLGKGIKARPVSARLFHIVQKVKDRQIFNGHKKIGLKDGKVEAADIEPHEKLCFADPLFKPEKVFFFVRFVGLGQVIENPDHGNAEFMEVLLADVFEGTLGLEVEDEGVHAPMMR